MGNELTAKMSSISLDAFGVSTDMCALEDETDDGSCFVEMESVSAERIKTN